MRCTNTRRKCDYLIAKEAQDDDGYASALEGFTKDRSHVQEMQRTGSDDSKALTSWTKSRSMQQLPIQYQLAKVCKLAPKASSDVNLPNKASPSPRIGSKDDLEAEIAASSSAPSEHSETSSHPPRTPALADTKATRLADEFELLACAPCDDHDAWMSKQRLLKRMKRLSSGSIHKRTLSQSIGSDTDDEDVKPYDANEIGASASGLRRLRRKTGKRLSLIFDDPPQRIVECDESESREDEVVQERIPDMEEMLMLALPYYEMDTDAAAIAKPPIQRPKHERVFCQLCNEGFRGVRELSRHHDRQHKGLVEKWVCIEPEDGINTQFEPSGLVGLATFALQASVALYKTVNSFNSHQEHVHDFAGETSALSGVLGSLTETITSTDLDLATLEVPLQRCGKACEEFEQEIQKCSQRSGGSRASFRDWARLRYMGDDIDSFRRVLSRYKMTISIALSDANL
jgi:hypothetical protein